jgi:hypothetical protein
MSHAAVARPAARAVRGWTAGPVGARGFERPLFGLVFVHPGSGMAAMARCRAIAVDVGGWAAWDCDGRT